MAVDFIGHLIIQTANKCKRVQHSHWRISIKIHFVFLDGLQQHNLNQPTPVMDSLATMSQH